MVLLQIEASYGIGSTGNIAYDINACAEKNGWECYVASPLVRPDLEKLPHIYKIGNWLDHKIHGFLCRVHGKQAYFSTIPTLRLIKFIKKIKPDIIQFHDLHSNYINLNLLLKHIAITNTKLVITLHDCWFFTGGCFHYTSVGCDKWMQECGDCPKRFVDTPAYFGDRSSKILKDRIKYLSSISNLTVVGVSEWITNEFKKSRIKAGRVLTIHNGIDTEVFKPIELNIKTRLGLEDKFVLLGPASKWLLTENQKTLEYFSANMPEDTILLLYGNRGRVEGLPENVILYGFVDSKIELSALYASCDVFVNCSREDTLSTINLEAQACGTPVVTYDATGSVETVEGKCGYAVKTGDYIALLKASLQIKKEGKSQYSRACVEFIKNKFNKEQRYRDYLALASGG